MAQHLEIDRLNEITNTFAREIGSGTFGTVYVGTLDYENDVAVKRHSKKKDGEGEKKVLEALNHENIIKLRGYGEDGEDQDTDHYYIVMDKMDGTLQELIEKGTLDDKPIEFNFADILKILTKVASAIVHIGNRGFVNGDIKPANILINKDLAVKLCDFGSARKGGLGMEIGTKGYTATEIDKQNHGHMYLSDLFSLGTMILQLIMGDNDIAKVPSKAQSLIHQQYYHFNKKEDDEKGVVHISAKARAVLMNNKNVVLNSKFRSVREHVKNEITKLAIQCTEVEVNSRLGSFLITEKEKEKESSSSEKRGKKNKETKPEAEARVVLAASRQFANYVVNTLEDLQKQNKVKH